MSSTIASPIDVVVTPLPSSRPPAIPLAEARRRASSECRPGRYVQGSLAELDFGATTTDDDFGPQPTPSANLPDPHEWARRIGLAIVESMAGLRAPTQLVRWVLPEPYLAIVRTSSTANRRLAAGASRIRRRIRVRAVTVCEPADGVAEASLVMQDDQRVRALALRLIGRDGHWRVETFQLA